MFCPKKSGDIVKISKINIFLFPQQVTKFCSKIFETAWFCFLQNQTIYCKKRKIDEESPQLRQIFTTRPKLNLLNISN